MFSQLVSKMFSEHELAALAKSFREKSGKKKATLARELKLGSPTIQQAEEYPHLSLTKVRRRIIESCSAYELVGPVYFLKRKDKR
jgi:hypothetical protein